jgi:hypothetical protein
MHDPRAALAAGNNADMYEAMFASWRLRCRRSRVAFIGEDVPPPYYSNLTVLSPGHQNDFLSELRRTAGRLGGRVGFKDSFVEFDLADNGFRVLLEACWIWRVPEVTHPEAGWSIVENAAGLEGWEAAWKKYGSPTKSRMFRESMLGRPDIKFWGKKAGAEFVAGCIANMSAECVGISNLFCAPSDEDVFGEATRAVGSMDRHRPIVGYVAGPRLDAARRAGFVSIGALRILTADKACFQRHLALWGR